MTHHVKTLQIIISIFFATSTSLWNCVQDSSQDPKSYFCACVDFHTALFYVTPTRNSRLLLSITSADITYNFTKGFNWRSQSAAGSVSVCETVESAIQPASSGLFRLDSICLLNVKKGGSFTIQLKISDAASIPIFMYVESALSLKSRLGIQNASLDLRPTREELEMGEKHWRTLPHFSEWSRLRLQNPLFTFGVRACSHPLCPANFFLDVSFKQIPHNLEDAIRKQMKAEQKLKKQSPLPDSPVVRLGLESLVGALNTSIQWVALCSDVTIHCSSVAMAIKLPLGGHVRPTVGGKGTYVVRMFSYSKEGLYQCIRQNLTRGKSVHLKVDDCRRFGCRLKNEICFGYRKGAVIQHACLAVASDRLFRESIAAIPFGTLWLVLVSGPIIFVLQYSKRTRDETRRELKQLKKKAEDGKERTRRYEEEFASPSEMSRLLED